MKLVKATAFTGIEVLSLICFDVNTNNCFQREYTNLAKNAPARKASVSRKCPADTRSRSREPNVCTDCEDHDNRGHHSGAGSRLNCLMEDGHKWECGILCKDRVHITHAEEHGENHGKSQRAVNSNACHNRPRDDNLRILDLLGQLQDVNNYS